MPKFLLRLLFATGFILLLPLVAMQFTDEVVWTLGDFIIAGTLLFVAGLTFELLVRNIDTRSHRVATGIAVLTALILVWVNGAVGIIGSEDIDANMMYFGVLAVGIIGAIIARFRPLGMSRALFATAVAQTLVTVIALIAGMYNYQGSSVFEIVSLNAFFIALWLSSARQFQSAAREQPPN